MSNTIDGAPGPDRGAQGSEHVSLSAHSSAGSGWGAGLDEPKSRTADERGPRRRGGRKRHKKALGGGELRAAHAPDERASRDERAPRDAELRGETARRESNGPAIAGEAGEGRAGGRSSKRRRRGRRSGERAPAAGASDGRPEGADGLPEGTEGSEHEGVDARVRPQRAALTHRSRDAEAAAGEAGASSGAPKRKRRKRSRRSGRAAEGEAAAAREPRAEEPAEDGQDAADEAGGFAARERPAEGGEGPRRRRRRGSRGGKRRGAATEEDGAVAVDEIPGEEDWPEELAPVREREREPARGSKSARRSKKKSEEEDDDDAPEGVVDAKPNVILVNASDPDETRVAVVEDAQIADFQMTVKNQQSLVNDIYRGKVVNLEPAIGAAFIDFGQGRNGFLHTSDVLSCYGESDWELRKLLSMRVDVEEWDAESSQPNVGIEFTDEGEGDGEAPKGSRGKKKAPSKRFHARPRRPITELLKKGQSVVVQVTKDAIGDKGPTLTTYISIPGRHLVLMPSVARTGVSRKIDDEKERRRLKRILKGLKVPEGMGVIVRTAGTGATKAELTRDLEYLLLIWDTFGKRLQLGRGPLALYEESDVAIRTMRDLFTPGTRKVIVDDERVHAHMVEFTQRLMPEAVDRIERHDGRRPLFHTFNVEQDFERIFARRVDLASGGSIVFDQTEALVAIDVNSGKTRSDGFDFEDVALKTNLEAVPEIARQIKLRDLGGIVVVDFIDMSRVSNRRTVERAFRDAMASDRARAKLGRISQFGLLELTRQRLGAGMSKMVFTNCARCRGTGRIRTVDSRAMAILRRLGAAMTLKGFTQIELRAHPEVIEFLKKSCSAEIEELSRMHERELVLTGVTDQVEDSVLRYLRADGREVRPGGRRKR